MPAVRFVKETVPCECSVSEKILGGVRGAINDVIDALVVPARPEELSPPPRPTEVTRGSVFSGDLQEVQRFFYNRGWTDGLPIIPPTRERVDEMLTGTELPPEHVVGKMIPRLGKVTIEKIAINAVMAGALPTAMPVLIAGVEALLDPLSTFGTFGSAPVVVAVLYRERTSNQLLSTGARVRSARRHCQCHDWSGDGADCQEPGQCAEGCQDMGVLGNPGKYTMVLGETEASPGPQQAQHGFDRHDNTVTVSFPNGYVQIVPRGSDVRAFCGRSKRASVHGGVR